MSMEHQADKWELAVAGLIASGTFDQTCGALSDALEAVAANSQFALMEFGKNSSPAVVTHNLNAADEKHYLERYIAGPYLLDPLYELAMQDDKPSSCRFREAAPDRFRSSEYYRQYCDRTHLEDEVDFFLDVDEDATLVLVVAKLRGRFTRSEFALLTRSEPILHASLRKLWNQWEEGGRRDEVAILMHERLNTCFENFGESTLTQREREITQLLLRGHSTKSIARVLNIAPGTVMVHKRNLFAKLGITSQYELFSSFIDALSPA